MEGGWKSVIDREEVNLEFKVTYQILILLDRCIFKLTLKCVFLIGFLHKLTVKNL